MRSGKIDQIATDVSVWKFVMRMDPIPILSFLESMSNKSSSFDIDNGLTMVAG